MSAVLLLAAVLLANTATSDSFLEVFGPLRANEAIIKPKQGRNQKLREEGQQCAVGQALHENDAQNYHEVGVNVHQNLQVAGEDEVLPRLHGVSAEIPGEQHQRDGAYH